MDISSIEEASLNLFHVAGYIVVNECFKISIMKTCDLLDRELASIA